MKKYFSTKILTLGTAALLLLPFLCLGAGYDAYPGRSVFLGTDLLLLLDDAAGPPKVTYKMTIASAGPALQKFQTQVYEFCLSDETTAITTGVAKVTWRAPFAMTITAVRASLTTASSSGLPTVDINEAGATILSTKLTIDASELTSTTAATAAVLSDTSFADDALITFDIDVAGTGATGLKVKIYYTR